MGVRSKRYKQGRGPSRSTHNRQAQVLKQPHPDCEACADMEEKLEKQIVANGTLRLELYDLRRAFNRLTTGRDFGLPDRRVDRGSTDRTTQGTCTHGIPVSSSCARCGIVEE